MYELGSEPDTVGTPPDHGLEKTLPSPSKDFTPVVEGSCARFRPVPFFLPFCLFLFGSFQRSPSRSALEGQNAQRPPWDAGKIQEAGQVLPFPD